MDILRRICSSYELVLLIGISLLAGVISYHSPITYTESDPLGSLLTAQTIVKTGSIKLDEYAGREYVPSLDEIGNTGRFRRYHGHCYYYFPLGTPILATPFVYYANLCGMDMIDPSHDARVQNILSAGTVAITALLCYILTRCLFPAGLSFILTIFLVFGSPFMSTMGTAFWSTNTATIFVILLIVHLVLHHRGLSQLSPQLMAGLFVIAFICRPTALLVTIPAIVYVFQYQRRSLVRLLVWCFLFISPFVLLSIIEFRRFLPEYYLPYRLPRENLMIIGLLCALITLGAILFSANQSVRHFTRNRKRVVIIGSSIMGTLLLISAFQFLPHLNLPHQRIPLLKLRSLYGHIASPGRGLLIFSPYLIPVIIGLGIRNKKLFSNPLVLLSLVWLILHVVVISRPFRWWGGHCFGSRLLTEAFPAAALLTIIVTEQFVSGNGKYRRVAMIILVVTGISAVFFNTLQGTLNPYTARWNSEPDIDEYPHYLFSWRYPQFLAGPELLDERLEYHNSTFRIPIAMKELDTHIFGTDITATSETVYFDGWNDRLTEERITYRLLKNEGEIWFWIGGFERTETHLYIALHADVSHTADVEIALNRRTIGTVHLEPGVESVDSLLFRDHLLRPKVRNVFSFSLVPTDTSSSANTDSSFAGLRFRRLELNTFGLPPDS